MNASYRTKFGRWSAILLFAAILLLLPTFASAGHEITLNFDVDADLNPIAAGQVIDNEWNTPRYGSMVITSPTSGTNPIVVFDSTAAALTGGDDDLGSPNETCTPAGPGIGVGGEVGAPFENCTPLGNVIIIEENCSVIVGDMVDYSACMPDFGALPGPDDNVGGGTINFTFGTTVEEQVTIESFELLDFEDAAGAGGVTVNAYDFAGALVDSFAAPAIGDNGSAVVDIFSFPTSGLPWVGVSRLEFVLEGSGSVGTLSYTLPNPTAISLDSFGIRSNVTYYGIVAVLMLGALSMASLSLFRREQVPVRA